MEHRYFFLNGAGRPQGPVWLGEMRRLWRSGGIGPETQVCPDGTDDWDAARTYSEITSAEPKMPDQESGPQRRERMFSFGIWVFILVCAILMAGTYYFVIGLL